MPNVGEDGKLLILSYTADDNVKQNNQYRKLSGKFLLNTSSFLLE